MIGPLEIVVLVFIVLLVFGGTLYRRLPQLGRRAGEGARRLGETAMEKGGEAKQVASTTREKHGDKLDPAKLAKQAGKGVREARELRDSLAGAGTSTGDTGKAPTSTAPARADQAAPHTGAAEEARPDPRAPRPPA